MYFQGGYYRFLRGRLNDKILKNELIYLDGVVLTWTKYKRKNKNLSNHFNIKGRNQNKSISE